MGDDGCRCVTGPAPTEGTRAAPVSRRGVLAGSAAVAATLALAACSGSGGGDAAPGADGATPPPDGSGSGAGEALTGTAGIAVGGGVVVPSSAGPVVVTHPSADEFRAFSARCPHQGCPVSTVVANTITCNCHGSTFDAATGDRLGGPAPRGLAALEVTVQDDAVYLT